MMNTSRSCSPVQENKGQGLWPRVVKEDGFHLKAISQEERNLCLGWNEKEEAFLENDDFTEKKILPDTKKGVWQWGR